MRLDDSDEISSEEMRQAGTWKEMSQEWDVKRLLRQSAVQYDLEDGCVRVDITLQDALPRYPDAQRSFEGVRLCATVCSYRGSPHALALYLAT